MAMAPAEYCSTLLPWSKKSPQWKSISRCQGELVKIFHQLSCMTCFAKISASSQWASFISHPCLSLKWIFTRWHGHAVMEGGVPLSRRWITEALEDARSLVKVMDGHVTKLTVQSGWLHALRTSFSSSSSPASDFPSMLQLQSSQWRSSCDRKFS